MRFGILGTLHAQAAQAPVEIGGPRHAKALAGLLVNANRVVPVRWMVEFMWDGEGPATAVRQVQDAVSGLRRAFARCDAPGDLITTSSAGYRIRLEPSELDVLEFEWEQAAAQQCTRSADTVDGLRRALASWRGPALPEFSGRLVEGEAARLNARRVTALRQCLGLELDLGRHQAVAVEGAALLHEHPHDEQLAEMTMLALYRCGRRGEAMELYRSTRLALVENLGVEPAGPLQTLHQRLLDADPALEAPEPVPAGAAGATGVAGAAGAADRQDPPMPRQLPAVLSDFTGREELSAQAETLLADAAKPGSSVALAVLAGAGGIGKTSLAVHLAHRVVPHYPDCQLYVDLHGADGPSAKPGEVLTRFLRGLGIPPDEIPADPEERETLYRSTLSGRRALVLLDNARDAAQVRPLLPGPGGSAVLVTSRSTLPGLDGARRFAVDALGQDKALDLFTRIVGAEAVRADPDAVAAILEVCAGLPLAIRIAASRVAYLTHLSLGAVADQLAEEGHLLDALEVEDRAVRATFAMSYRSLPPDQARAFRMLGLWQGPFVGSAAAAALLQVPAREAARILSALAEINLLQPLGPDRYRLHDLLRVYAAECARRQEPDAARADATHRILTWYLQTSAAAARIVGPEHRHVALAEPPACCRALDFTDLDQALAWWEEEGANLTTAVALAARGGNHEIAWKLPITMWRLFQTQIQVEDRIGCYETALAGARALGDEDAAAWVSNGLSNAYQAAGRVTQAERCLREALAIRNRLGEPRGQATCLLNLGYVLSETGRASEAVEHLERALRICREISLKSGERTAHTNLGEAHKALGNLETALGYYISANAMAEADEDLFDTSRDTANLAEILFMLGRYAEAADYATMGNELSLRAGNTCDQAVTLDILGRIRLSEGRPDAALAYWQEAHTLFTSLGNPRADEVSARIVEVRALT